MLRTLLSVRVASFFSGIVGKNKNGKASKGRVVVLSLAFILLLMMFVGFFVTISASLAMSFVPAGMDTVYFAMFNIITFSLVFFFSIFETKSQLFECRDNELLLSMPVRPGDIVISRILAVLLLNLGESLIVMIPAAIMYGVFGGNPLYIFTSLVTALLVSLLATVLASGVGYLVALLAAKFKKNSFISLGLYIVFLALYFILYFAFMESITMLESDPDAALDAMEALFGPIKPLGEISLFYPLPFAILVTASLGGAALAWFIISKNYTKIITGERKSETKKYVKTPLKSGSVFSALAKKELGAFFASATYMLNAAMGVILQILFAGFILFSGAELIATANVLFSSLGIPVEGTIEIFVTVVLIALSGMTMISASALSIEGKYYWILKSSPLSPENILYAKLVPHLVISMPASLISSILLAIAISAEPLWWIFIILVPQVACLMFAMFGLILNIAMPKFSFESEAQVVKQSAPVGICTIGAMLLIPILIAASMLSVIFLNAVITAVIISALMLLLFVTVYLILTGPSARKLAKIEG